MARKSQTVTYCVVTFYVDTPIGNRQIVDESAVLIKLTGEEIEVVSTFPKFKKEAIQSITVSIIDGRNAYLIINGPVINITDSDNGTHYVIKAPKKNVKTLPNGDTLNIECIPIVKYCNIHKPKRKKKEAVV